MIKSKRYFRYYDGCDTLSFEKGTIVNVIGVIFDRPTIELNQYGEFIEYKLYLYHDLTSFISVTIICHLRAECIPRLQFLPNAVGKVVIIQNVEVDEERRLYVDTRKKHKFQIGVLDLSRFRTNLEPYINKDDRNEKPIPLDHPYTMNLRVDSFPNKFSDIEAFRKIAGFVRRCQRNVQLVKYNPSLAQRSVDFETKYICTKIIVSTLSN